MMILIKKSINMSLKCFGKEIPPKNRLSTETFVFLKEHFFVFGLVAWHERDITEHSPKVPPGFIKLILYQKIYIDRLISY